MWYNVTVDEYKDILSIINDNMSLLDKCMYIQNYFNIRDFNDSFWDNCNSKELIEEINKIKWVFEPVKEMVPKDVVDLNTINFGLYIDLFSAIVNNDDKELLRLLNCEDRIVYLFYYKNRFAEYYNILKTNHTLIYGTEDVDDTIEEINVDDIKDAIEKSNAVNAIKKNKNQKKFSWLSMVYLLCDESLSNYSTIISTSNNLCHNWLSYKIGKERGFI